MIINPQWKAKMLEQIAQSEKPLDVTLNYNQAAQWLIKTLADKGIAFRVIQLGAGAKRITTQTDICPKCNGTGRC